MSSEAFHDFVENAAKYKDLCRRVLNSPNGKELVAHWDRLFVDVPLYQGSDRETVYAVAQRDLITEIKDHAGLDRFVHRCAILFLVLILTMKNQGMLYTVLLVFLMKSQSMNLKT